MSRAFTDCESPHPQNGCVTCRPTEVLGARLTAQNRAIALRRSVPVRPFPKKRPYKHSGLATK